MIRTLGCEVAPNPKPGSPNPDLPCSMPSARRVCKSTAEARAKKHQHFMWSIIRIHNFFVITISPDIIGHITGIVLIAF